MKTFAPPLLVDFYVRKIAKRLEKNIETISAGVTHIRKYINWLCCPFVLHGQKTSITGRQLPFRR
jgi:hypothetical protein